MLETNLLFDAEHAAAFLRNVFGLQLEQAGYQKRLDLSESDAVKEMGCWPSGNSIAVIDDTLVIKLSDRKEGV